MMARLKNYYCHRIHSFLWASHQLLLLLLSMTHIKSFLTTSYIYDPHNHQVAVLSPAFYITRHLKFTIGLSSLFCRVVQGNLEILRILNLFYLR